MATKSNRGAVQVGGIDQQQAGNNDTLVQQSNGVIRVQRLQAKRKRKVVISETVRQIINIVFILIVNHFNHGSN